MTCEEFSNEFDTLLNNYSTIQGTIKLDEYEKSVFLTNAQEEIVLGMYNGKNPFGDSFERTEEIRRYLSSLVKTYKTTDKKEGYTGLSKYSIFFELPDDLWFITYEAVNLKSDKSECINDKYISIIPITQDEYHRIRKNPFRDTNERRALRLDLSNSIVEVISKYDVESYLVRYLSRPTPIILTNLVDNLTINKESIKTECKLHPALHKAIRDRAVQLAISSRANLNGAKQ